MMRTATLVHGRPERHLIDEVGARSPDLDAEILTKHPFFELIRFQKPKNGKARPRLLLVIPWSGFAACVLGELSAALAGIGDLDVLAWRDARDIQVSHGPFGLDDQVDAISEVLERVGQGVTAIGLSQSVVPVMAAAALHPGSIARLVLIGGPVDPYLEPTPVERWAQSLPDGVLASLAITVVPAGHDGAGRLVYPGTSQLSAYAAASPHLYLQTQAGHLLSLAGFGGADELLKHDDMHAIADVPAELFLDTARRIFRDAELARGSLAIRGRKLRLDRLSGIPLFTVEAGRDELVGPGQTAAAHRLTGASPAGRHIVLPGARHHDLFVGPGFQEWTRPALTRALS